MFTWHSWITVGGRGTWNSFGVRQWELFSHLSINAIDKMLWITMKQSSSINCFNFPKYLYLILGEISIQYIMTQHSSFATKNISNTGRKSMPIFIRPHNVLTHLTPRQIGPIWQTICSDGLLGIFFIYFSYNSTEVCSWGSKHLSAMIHTL